MHSGIQEKIEGSRESVIRDVLNSSRFKGRTIHPCREVEGIGTSTGRPEGYRIPRGEQRSNVVRRLPFLLTYSCQLGPILVPLKSKGAGSFDVRHKRGQRIVLASFQLSRSLTQAHKQRVPRYKGRGGDWSKPSDPLMVPD